MVFEALDLYLKLKNPNLKVKKLELYYTPEHHRIFHYIIRKYNMKILFQVSTRIELETSDAALFLF